MSFINPDFLLQTPAARQLFHDYAETEPILDYHNHLPPRDIAENRQFANLHEIWLEGDHYKWRAMRAAGVDENLITGAATPRDKFMAWARVVPLTLRNPLYHWTHLELKRYFGIDELLDEQSAPRIWEQANEQLAQSENSARGLLKKFDVRALCTTDDPADDLVWHRQIAESDCATRVYPTFRPDKSMALDDFEALQKWMKKLGQTCNREVKDFATMIDALEQRHDDFHALGGRLSDHGLSHLPTQFDGYRDAENTFWNAEYSGPHGEDGERFAGFMMQFFGELDARKGWTKQLHLGARRNNNAKMFAQLGADTGYDSIGDWSQTAGLGAYFSKLSENDSLPQTIVYNLNPADNYAIATMMGNFQGGGKAGKMQFGSGWWFLDQKEAMEWQINALSNVGLLSQFVGMLTDSRSFMSFPRHEYFRRVLCNLIGQDMENGLLPSDYQLVGGMIRNICFANARDYLGLGSE